MKDKIYEKDLEDGKILESAVHQFHAESNEINALLTFSILHDSNVWVPCNAILSETDQKRAMEMFKTCIDNNEDIKGKIFKNKDQIRMVPDILQSGDHFYFPIFSSKEVMGEYGENFSKVQMPALEAIILARNNDKKPCGIVLNAFTEPFEISADFYGLIEKMKSRLTNV